MKKEILRQGDIVYLDFSPSVDTEISGIRPAVVVSSDVYNYNSSYIMVVPVTSGGTDFGTYVELKGYRNVHGRVNASQVHCFSTERVRSRELDHLRVGDFNKIRQEINKILGGNPIYW